MDSSSSSLGEFLRSHREKKGISLEQLSASSKINVKLLSHLENDHYSELPAKPFIRGFVISYCRIVGLNSQDVLTQYQAFLNEHEQDRPVQDSGHKGYAFEKKEQERSQWALWGVLGSFVFVGGVLIFILKPALNQKRMNHVEALRQEYHAPKREKEATPKSNQTDPGETKPPGPLKLAKASEGQSPSAEKVQSSTPDKEKTAMEKADPESSEGQGEDDVEEQPSNQALEIWPQTFKSAEPYRSPGETDELHKGDQLTAAQIRHKFVVKAKQDVWLRYQVDQRPVMSFILKEGRLLVLRANRTIRFETPRPDALQYRTPQRTYADLERMEGIVNQENRGGLLVFPKAATSLNREVFDSYRPLPREIITRSSPNPNSSTSN